MGASPSARERPKRDSGTGDSRIRHEFFDNRLSGLHENAQLLYFHLNRYRDRGGDVTIPLSWRTLTGRIPVSESTLRRAYAVLNAAGLASVHRPVFGKGSTQGNIFWVARGESPSTRESPSTGDTHKKKDLKEQSKREAAAPKDCPDCLGTGMYYPEGFDKGVARCQHKNLSPTGR